MHWFITFVPIILKKQTTTTWFFVLRIVQLHVFVLLSSLELSIQKKRADVCLRWLETDH